MGNDYGCICSKDTGDVPVPSSDYKFDNPEVIENSPMKQSMMKSQSKGFNITNRGNEKIIKIQSTYLRHYTIKKFIKILTSRRQQFDSNIINFAKIIPNDNNNELNSYINDTVKQVEESLIPFVPSNIELSKYHHIFDRDAYLFTDSNSIYKGSWNYNGKKHGFGTFIDNIGNKYIGFWENDKFSNRGRLIDKEGNCFEGIWKEGKANGTGVLTMMNGYRYEGNWENDYQQGKGVEKFDGSKYEGTYSKGKKEGRGEYTWEDGSRYIGGFENGQINGEGEFEWPDGRHYKGQWSNGQMCGKGEFTWPNGKRYIGEYRQSKKEGYGTYYWSNNEYYEGNWLSNTQHGEGRYYLNGSETKGIFRYGKMIKNLSGGKDSNNQSEMKKTMKEYIGEDKGSVIPEVHDSFQIDS